VTSKIILRKDCNVFHGWHSQALRSVKAAKRIGAVSIVESGSNHPFFREEVLGEEYQRFGIKIQKDPAYVRRSALEELDLTDYILVVTEFAKETYIRAGIDGRKVLVLGRGADIARFRPSSAKDNVFRVLFAGRIGIRKGVQYLLEAWKGLNLTNAELILAGSVDENFKPILARYADLKNIILPGFVKKPEEVYKKASVFAFPSLEEGSAKVTYEALAAGLPLITTLNSGSIVRDGEDGFFVPIRDAGAIREKILYLYENREELERLGSNGRSAVMTHTWKHYQESLIKIYLNIMHLG
jgi:glycosyltransferase involved in cell wall biosynthesis